MQTRFAIFQNDLLLHLDQEEESIFPYRELTAGYVPADQTCITHMVILCRLKELEEDILQHWHLERDILFSRAINMEKELLGG